MLDMSKITSCGYTYRNNKTSATNYDLNASRAILNSSRTTTLGHPQRNSKTSTEEWSAYCSSQTVLNIKGISLLWDQMKIQMQTKQYHIRPKAQPENTHIEIAKPPQKSGQNIGPPRLLQNYPPLHPCMINGILNVNS